jgi:pantetheine-phosphate adenylyltransferase
MVKGIFAGSFDPPTLGHMDLIRRSLSFCDQLVVAIGINSQKKTFFSEPERFLQIKENLVDVLGFSDSPYNWKVGSFQGLLVDYAKEEKANILIRGVRNAVDFEYESQLAQINKKIAPEIETIFLLTRPELSIVSSSAVKEIARYNGDITGFVSPYVATKIREKLGFIPSAEEAAKVKTGFIKYGDPENK